MTVVINGTTGISGVDGSAGTPAVQGTDTNTGVFYPAADTVAVSTGGSERMRVDSSGNVGIGTTSPVSKFHVYNSGDVTQTIGSNTGASIINLLSNSNSSGAYNAILSTTASGQNWYIGGLGNANTLVFATGASTTERMRIDSSGNVLVTNVAGLGYGTGSGGTVTQATSKSTAVTLNKPTGQITMNNAALGAGASVSFTFNNSLIAATDMLLMNVSNGTSYTVQNYSVSSGLAQVRVTNITGGSLSEAAVLNFALIKGATS